MPSSKLEELSALRAQVKRLEEECATEIRAELAALPAKYGFLSAGDFARAVVSAADGRTRAGRIASKVAAPPRAPGRRRKRAKITDETRASVKKMVKEGKTGAEIAKALDISLPSVQNVKKALGLVRKK